MSASSEYESYYANFDANQDVDRPAETCACRGHGWILSDLDTWHECRAHYAGQPHPESE